MDWSDREFDGPDDLVHNDFETWLLEISNITDQNKSKLEEFKFFQRRFEKRGGRPQLPLNAPNVVEYLKTSLDFFNALNVLFQDSHDVQTNGWGHLIRGTHEAIQNASETLVKIASKAENIGTGDKDASNQKDTNTYSGQIYRNATVEESIDDDDKLKASGDAAPARPDLPRFNSHPSIRSTTLEYNGTAFHGESSSRQSSSSTLQRSAYEPNGNGSAGGKRRRTSSSDDEAQPKRKVDDPDTASRLTKKSKSSHVISHFGEEAVFISEIEFEDLSDEVDARLKMRAEQQAREKAKLQDTNIKRKKLSLDPIPAGSATADHHEQPRKRARTMTTSNQNI